MADCVLRCCRRHVCITICHDGADNMESEVSDISLDCSNRDIPCNISELQRTQDPTADPTQPELQRKLNRLTVEE